ncbi:unnamed protein product [Parascedosporium putredinis]|uniref:Uncharacterized protein n=1 Tax=Parascedosporium putredinis TaxID=1442378 RepID=A0A9P1M923_9PEZI|nr:unnamed protein product [Parascedosporium putredinis]CAI7990007.1 unnamed protein product [Parascedosporium putredinis]
MSSTLANQPLSKLLSSLRLSTTTSSTFLGPQTSLALRRSHQTTARTKRALRIRPHPSHVLRTADAPATATTTTTSSSSSSSGSSSALDEVLLFHGTDGSSSSAYVPPALRPVAEKKYHLSKDDVTEIRRRRWEDPETATIRNLAKEFDCSMKFVQIATQVPESYKEKLADGTRRMKATWGPRKLKAREDRKVRKQMLFHGEL